MRTRLGERTWSVFTNRGRRTRASQRPPAGTGPVGAKIRSKGRSERTGLLAECRKAGSLWGPGPGEELGLTLCNTYLSKPGVPEAQQGLVKLGIDYFHPGCAAPGFKSLLLQKRTLCNTDCTLETRESVGGSLMNFLPPLYSFCFSVIIRELQFDKESLDLF